MVNRNISPMLKTVIAAVLFGASAPISKLLLGAIGVLSACVLWGIDNNFIRNVSAKDPLSIVTIKGLSAGTLSLILSVILGFSLPSFKFVLLAMVLGISVTG